MGFDESNLNGAFAGGLIGIALAGGGIIGAIVGVIVGVLLVERTKLT